VSQAAAVTMVRDDMFFLEIWLRHYGAALGRENCYVVNHGRGHDVARLAEGCNVIGIPGRAHKNFDVKRWGLLNALVGGLRRYYRHVIVGDVDELVVVDPASGHDLRSWLDKASGGCVYTPVGLEVIHRVELEPEPITKTVLGPRRHVRLAPHYSKPCVVSAPTKLSRGGHFAQFPTLHTPDALYLFHLKFCDFAAYSAAMDRRNAVAAETGVSFREAAIGRHWYASQRGDDKAVFAEFAALRMEDGFQFDWLRRRMHTSFQPRGETGYYEFRRPGFAQQYVLPERFIGLF